MSGAEKVFKGGVQRESGWLYYFNQRNASVMRARMVRGGQKKGKDDKPEVVLKTDVKSEPGYLYFIDKQGDVARKQLNRGGTARKKKRTKKAAGKKPAKKAAKKAAKKPAKKAAKKAAKKPAAKKPAKKAKKKK